MLTGGAVAIDQIHGPADAGNEGCGVDVRIGMMLPMSVSDGAGLGARPGRSARG
jgi:hypothetical protein